MLEQAVKEAHFFSQIYVELVMVGFGAVVIILGFFGVRQPTAQNPQNLAWKRGGRAALLAGGTGIFFYGLYRLFTTF